jgi:hypothetical protein
MGLVWEGGVDPGGPYKFSIKKEKQENLEDPIFWAKNLISG